MKRDPSDKDATITDDSVPGKNDEDFLTRWSRRKQESRRAQEQLVNEPETPDAPLETTRHLTDEDMPPIESLDEDSDYSGFLSPKVSEELRKRALRKLFHSAGINVRDGLDDYDEDFTEFAKLGDIVTADVKHRLEQEMQLQDKVKQEEPITATTTHTQQETTVQSDQIEESDEGFVPEEEA